MKRVNIQDTGTLAKVLACIFAILGIWCMTVSYTVQGKLFDVQLEKRAIQANAGLLTCGWLFVFMAIFLFMMSRSKEHMDKLGKLAKNGKWVILAVCLILSITILGLSSNIKKSECSSWTTVDDGEDNCEKIEKKNKSLFTFTIVIIVLICLYIAYKIYLKTKQTSPGMEANQKVAFSFRR